MAVAHMHIPPPVKQVRLDLSIAEAEFLMVVMAYIYGDQEDSPRRHAAAISDALTETLQCAYFSRSDYDLVTEGSRIGFVKYEEG